MPKQEEVTKENTNSEKRDQIGTLGNSNVEWMGGQKGRRRRGGTNLLERRGQRGEMPPQKRR